MIMKALVQKLGFGILMGAALMAPVAMNAQIDYYYDFSSDEQRWSDLDFHTTDIAVCDDGFALRANPVNELGTVVPAETVSRSLGVSNGEEVVMSYNYKLLYYDDVVPHIAVDDPNWGMLAIEYGPTQNGPWELLDFISADNHYISDECATREIAFTPAEGEEVFLRITAGGGANPDISYFVYVDNISLLQNSLSIEPVVAESDFKVWPNPVTDYLNLDYNGAISDVVIYDMQGKEVVVEDIDRNFSRLDMSGLTNGNYIMKVYAGTELKTIPVVKK